MTAWKHIAVTGAAGGIGSAVGRRLVEEGYRVTLLDKKLPASPTDGATFFQVDSLDEAAVENALAGADVICHIGEVPNILRGMTGEEVFEINTTICRNVLAAAVKHRPKRVIYTSSCQYYGYWGASPFPADHLPTIWPIDERQPAYPTNGYAESKVANEAQCEAISEAHDLEIFRFRFPWVMPPDARPNPNHPDDWADQGIRDGFWTLLSREEAVQAFALAIRPDRPLKPLPSRCEAFHFLRSRVIGRLGIREKMRRFLPHFPPIPDGWPDDQPPVSCEKAETYLGWWPMDKR